MSPLFEKSLFLCSPGVENLLLVARGRDCLIRGARPGWFLTAQTWRPLRKETTRWPSGRMGSGCGFGAGTAFVLRSRRHAPARKGSPGSPGALRRECVAAHCPGTQAPAPPPPVTTAAVRPSRRLPVRPGSAGHAPGPSRGPRPAARSPGVSAFVAPEDWWRPPQPSTPPGTGGGREPGWREMPTLALWEGGRVEHPLRAPL